MPYIASQPSASTSTSHLLTHGQHHMESPTSYSNYQSSNDVELIASPPRPIRSLSLPSLEDEVTSNQADAAIGAATGGVPKSYAPRLKAAVGKLGAVRKAALGSKGFNWGSSASGAEPGVDPRKANFAHLAAPLNVSVSQWDQFTVEKEEYRENNTDNLQRWIESFDPEAQDGKVTWINVNGLNWTVIKALAIKFELHPLALEDALNYTRLSNSKADWFPESLFVRLLTHELIDPLDSAHAPPTHSKLSLWARLRYQLGRTTERSAELEALTSYDHTSLPGDGPEMALGEGQPTSDAKSYNVPSDRRRSVHQRRYSDHDGMIEHEVQGEKGLTAHAVVQRLTKKYRIPIRKQQLAIFMTKGCIISIFSLDGTSLLSPIYERLGTPGTVLRTSEDASMLLHALLDVTVDEVMTIAEAFRAELDVLEGRALIKPDTAGVKNLHVLSGQLLLLKRALTPLSALVLALRREDEARATMATRQGSDIRRVSVPKMINSLNDDVPGYLSRESRLYLSDIQDHIDSVLGSLEMFAFMANGTADFIFNSLSFSANQSMQWLTITTLIFLPMSFLTGYYGMNFSIFPDIGVFGEGGQPSGPNPKGDIGFFWKIAGPLVTITTLAMVLSQVGDQLFNFGLRAVNSQQRRDAVRRRELR